MPDLYKLKVGAGEAPIGYAPEMFPTGGMENYTGVHDYPYVHAVLIEHEGQRYAILCMDLVVIPEAGKIRTFAAAELGVEPENLILLNPHVLTTPHSILMGRPGTVFTPEQYKKQELMDKANAEAITKAAADAKATLHPAKFGYKNGYTLFNVNRVVETATGWSQGTCDEGDTDHSMPVFRFDDLDGNTIAIFYIVNCAAGMLEFTKSDDGGRLVSNDIAGASADFVRKEFPGATVFYLAGATGDQWQALRGKFGVVGRGGAYREIDLGDKGWFLMELMGARLGQQVVRAADSIELGDVDKLTLSKTFITVPGRKQARGPAAPGTKIEHIRDEDRQVLITVMTLDDVAWIGTTPEIQTCTVRAIKDASPFGETAFSGWTGQGEGSPGTYMVEKELYAHDTYQANKSCFYPGAAEELRDKVIEIIGDIKAKL